MILLLSTSDTDLLTAKAAKEHPDVEFRWANPARLMLDDVDALLGGTPIPGSGGATGSQPDIIIVRLLGGRRAWEEGLNKLLASGIPTIAVSGEQTMDAELTELSTAPSNVVTTAHRYLAEGGKITSSTFIISCPTLCFSPAWGSTPQSICLNGEYWKAGKITARQAFSLRGSLILDALLSCITVRNI